MEKELIYTRHFEEGYNIFDLEYVHCLQRCHPESVPAGYTTSGDNSVDGHTSEDPLNANISQSCDIGTGKENVLK